MVDLGELVEPPAFGCVWRRGPGRVHAGRDGSGRVRVVATSGGRLVYDVRLTPVPGGHADAEEWETALAEARRLAEGRP